MGLPIARLMDLDSWHDCQQPLRLTTSVGVYANGIPVSLLGDPNTPHIVNGKDPCSKIHIGNIGVGSPTVYVNGKPVGRVTSAVGGCGMVVSGSNNVYVA